MPLILNREDVISVLEMKDCINILEDAFVELSNGTAKLPLRTAITPPNGLSLYMPAYLQEMNALACKVVTVYKDNPEKHNLPTTIGKVLLQDATTGEVICIMDGGYLTAVRTGAVSGLATQFLARENSQQVVGVFGAGVQAQMQLWAMCEVRDISRAIVTDKFPEASQNFAKLMSTKLSIQVDIADNPDDLLSADIICTATSSPTPIFDGTKVQNGTHINGIGSHSPNARELDSTVIKRSLLIADSYEACLAEAGDIMIPISNGEITKNHIHADLGEIVTDKKTARSNDEQITIFKSNGLAIQDAATAKLIYDKAMAGGIGSTVEI
ncbi:MAG: ornithine cyclodeaminase family protein [Candidatus Marinimicrobia bacterium]|nr:ornithine cyclodeaminase family protein [Candidatus Neomarinimicrobiota bacterium]MBL7022480.1 ornithine cyclodeaminase family protein [Candidatus Neomarinimicrobiota bacterium]MBL7108665.1 ornithine cyclodeaminase family protein [Candidatus Neomarinimicrobiota bacterium]